MPHISNKNAQFLIWVLFDEAPRKIPVRYSFSLLINETALFEDWYLGMRPKIQIMHNLHCCHCMKPKHWEGLVTTQNGTHEMRNVVSQAGNQFNPFWYFGHHVSNFQTVFPLQEFSVVFVFCLHKKTILENSEEMTAHTGEKYCKDFPMGALYSWNWRSQLGNLCPFRPSPQKNKHILETVGWTKMKQKTGHSQTSVTVIEKCTWPQL